MYCCMQSSRRPAAWLVGNAGTMQATWLPPPLISSSLSSASCFPLSESSAIVCSEFGLTLSSFLQQNSILSLLDTKRCSSLNEQGSHSLSSIIKGASGGSYLESDADEQLILHLSFSQKVRLSHLLLRTTPSEIGKAPKKIKVYVNRPHLGFDDLDDEKAEHEVELTEEQVKSGDQGGGGQLIPLKVVKFQQVDQIAIAIFSNQADQETTRIDALDLFGSPVDTTNMAHLSKMDAEAEPRGDRSDRLLRTGLRGGAGSSGKSSPRYFVSGLGAAASAAVNVGNQAANEAIAVGKEASQAANSTIPAYSPDRSSGSAQTDFSSHSSQTYHRRRGSGSTSRTSVAEDEEDEIDGEHGIGGGGGRHYRHHPSQVNAKPMYPPRFTTRDQEEMMAEEQGMGGADGNLSGWHFAPLILALAPPIGAMLGGKAEHWSNGILICIASFWLYQCLRGEFVRTLKPN